MKNEKSRRPGPRVHDSKECIALVEEVMRASEREGNRVKKLLVEKDYDRMFNRLRRMGIVHGIIPKKGSKVRRAGSVRDDVVRAMRKMGKERCKQEVNYSKRSAVESFFQGQVW